MSSESYIDDGAKRLRERRRLQEMSEKPALPKRGQGHAVCKRCHQRRDAHDATERCPDGSGASFKYHVKSPRRASTSFSSEEIEALDQILTAYRFGPVSPDSPVLRKLREKVIAVKRTVRKQLQSHPK